MKAVGTVIAAVGLAIATFVYLTVNHSPVKQTASRSPPAGAGYDARRL